jgi:hypothetical protein
MNLWKFLGDTMELLVRSIQTIPVVLEGIAKKVEKWIEEFTSFVYQKYVWSIS